MWTFEILALVTVTFLFGGFVKGAIGLGLPVVALAFMAAPLGLEQAMAIMLVPCLLTNIWQAIAGPYFKELLRRLWAFLLAGFAGTWFGVSVLAKSSGSVLLVVLGCVLCAYSMMSLMRPQIPPPGPRERFYSPVVGGLGGVMFGMTGTFIIPGILYLQALGLSRNALVQSMGMTFVVISSGLSLSFVSHGLIGTDVALLSGFAVIPTIAGLLLGQRFRHKVSEEQFRRVFFAGLFFAGLYMIIRMAL
jgi:uncharacterized membrane protein YfcA